MQLSDILVESSQAALALQADAGSFPAGWNGPYHDTETSVRNTAHWLITLLKAHQLSGETRFKNAARRAAGYLTQPDVRPMGATFFCRSNPKKDFCNGLIGQAWVIEALVQAAVQLEQPELRELACEVFALHPFDEQKGLWHYVNVDGSHGGFDVTLNHQLMFAAAGAMLGEPASSTIGAQVTRFMDCVQRSHLRVVPSGRIFHFVFNLEKRRDMPTFVRTLRQNVRELRQKDTYMARKEIGYHAFNLYAFSILKRELPQHPFWNDTKCAAMLQFIGDDTYVAGLNDNKYAYPYNPSGFEVALALQTFSLKPVAGRDAAWWVEQQLRRCYDLDARLMQKATEDPATLAARLYEATRLHDVHVDLG